MLTMDELQGFWLREWIETDGQRDASQFAVRAQAGDDFVDVRVPAKTDSLIESRCLDDLDPVELRSILSASGFAGQAALKAGICTWNREINLHGKTTETGAGRLVFDRKGGLLETGVNHTYSEYWRLLVPPPLNVMRLVSAEHSAIFIYSANRFALAIDKLTQPVLDHSDRNKCISRYSYSEYSFGNWSLRNGVAIKSSNPFQKGKTVLSIDGDEFSWFRNTRRGLTEMYKFEPCDAAVA